MKEAMAVIKFHKKSQKSNFSLPSFSPIFVKSLRNQISSLSDSAYFVKEARIFITFH